MSGEKINLAGAYLKQIVIDYEANKSASTGSFELVYQKNLPTNIKNTNLQVQGIPVTANYFYEPEEKEVKQPIEVEKITTQSVPNMQGLDAIDYVKHIGNGMRKTLEDLLQILRKEKEKRHARKNKSVITILSNIITETKESQTEYRNHSRIISETFIKSQILEVDEPNMYQKLVKNKKQVPPATNASMPNSGFKHKGDSEDNSVGIQVQKKKPNINKKSQQNEKKTTIKSKTNVNIVEGNKETKPIVSNKVNIKRKPQKGMEVKSVGQPKLYVTENLQENGKETVTINQSDRIYQSDRNESLQGIEMEAKITIESKLDINGKHQENKNEIIQPKFDVIEENQNGNKAQIIIQSRSVVNEKFQENRRERKPFFQCKSYTYGKSQENEKEPEIISQCKSDIGKFQENEEAKLIIQYKSDINEKLLENRKESNTIAQSKSNIYGFPQNEKENRTIIPSESKQNGTEAKKNKKNTNSVKTSDHNSSLHSNTEQLDKVKRDKCNLNTNNTSDSPVTNNEIKEKTQNNSVSSNTSTQIKNNKKNNFKKSSNASKTAKDNASELNDVTKTLLHFFQKAKQNGTNKQQ